MPIDKKVESGRRAVDSYRQAHSQLYISGWHKGIPEEHTPLLNTMLAEFKKQGFNSLQEFWDASDLENVQELGFVDKKDFEAKATEVEREALDGMWN